MKNFLLANSKSEARNIHPVRYRPNLFFLKIYNTVKIIWSTLSLMMDFILRGRQILPKISSLQDADVETKLDKIFTRGTVGEDARKIYLWKFFGKIYKFQCYKKCFEFRQLGFRYCFEFRNSKLVFLQKEVGIDQSITMFSLTYG